MMAVSTLARTAAAPRPSPATVEWNETVAMAAERMHAGRCEALAVVNGAQPVGTVTRQDIERCEAQGNWLDSVLVIDIIRRPRIAAR